MGRRLLVAALTLVVVVTSSCEPTPTQHPPFPSPGAPGPGISYVHDALGRLTAVIDPSQGVARYFYDAMGNITSITRPSLDEVAIFEFVPDWGPAGSDVTIYGTGFGSSGGSNAVSFAGTAASIVSESATRIVATVPDGASTGKISLTVGGKTVTSDTEFDFGARTPSIASVEPLIAAVGDSVTVKGTHFGAEAADNDLVMNRTRGRIESVGSERLVTFVPEDTGSGPVSIGTIYGEATGPDLFVVPGPYTVDQVAATLRLQPRTPTNVDVPAGKIALLAVTGTAGRRLTVAASSSSGSGSMLLYDTRSRVIPLANPFNAAGVATNAPLPVSGTYTLLIDNSGSLVGGPVTVTVDEALDVDGDLAADGVAVTATTTAPGQHAILALDAKAGDRLVVNGSAFAMYAIVTVIDPYGMSIRSASVRPDAEALLFEAIDVTLEGRYLIDVDPDGASVGSATLRVTRPAEDVRGSISVDGQPVTTANTEAGQNAVLALTGRAGQRVSGTVSVSAGCVDVSINATGTAQPVGTVAACSNATAFLEPITLPSDGQYTVRVDWRAADKGTATVTLFDVSTDVTGTVPTDGTQKTVDIGTPGQRATLTFRASAGQAYRVAAIGGTIQYFDLGLLDPKGTRIGGTAPQAPTSLDTGPLLAGTYTLVIDPQVAYTGTFTVAVAPLDSARSGDSAGEALAAAGLAASAAGSQAGLRSTDSVPDTRALTLVRSSGSCTTGLMATPTAETLPLAWRPSTEERWVPTDANMAGDWTTHRGPTPWEWTAPFMAPSLTTALSGRVLRLDGRPLAGVLLSVGSTTACTDSSGRFLLGPLAGGFHELAIDGSTAGGLDGAYGTFEVGISLIAGQTNVLPFTIWQPLLDTAHVVDVPASSNRDLVVTNPLMPGLELRVPAASTLRDDAGKRVTQIGLSPVPTDRPPFPLPMSRPFTTYFTVQPHGIIVEGEGATVIYPNATAKPAGSPASFWYYEADEGWERYGGGSVSADGRSVVPAPGVELDELVPAALPDETDEAGTGPVTDQTDAGQAGEPVDLATGLYFTEHSDLFIDDVMPLDLRRTYRTNDPAVRPLGVGSTFPYEMHLYTRSEAEEVKLALPNGAAIRYDAIGPGSYGQVYEHRETPGKFYGSRVFWATEVPRGAWWVALRDGTRYLIPAHASLQEIRDRHGNAITISRAGGFQTPATQVTSPSGRWISLVHADPRRPALVTSASDTAGRTVSYGYDDRQRLTSVTDADGGETRYEYDDSGNLVKATTPRGIEFLRNEFDGEGRVVRQTQADGGVHRFEYTMSGERVGETLYTDPLGHRRRISFNDDGYVTKATFGLGEPGETTTTFEIDPGANRVMASVDGLGRRFEFAYDSLGRVVAIAQAAGAPEAARTQYAYDDLGQLVSVTDPAGGVTTIARDRSGAPTGLTDASGRSWAIASGEDGQVTSIGNAAAGTIKMTYRLGAVTSVVDGAGNTLRVLADGAGRPRAALDPQGGITQTTFTARGLLAVRIDQLGNRVRRSYDADGNLTAVTNALGNETTYTYGPLQLMATRTDELGRREAFAYDGLGNLTSFVSAAGSTTTFSYDALNRPINAGFAAHSGPQSTIEYAWDAADRLLTATDSIGGTVSRTYDVLDRLIRETSGDNTIEFSYDPAGRRTALRPAGTDAIAYEHDPAGRLTKLSRGTVEVGFDYDDAGRVRDVHQPNGVRTTYGYNSAADIASISYASATSKFGSISYERDGAGRPTMVGGALGTTALPAALTSAAYDAAGQLVDWGGTKLTYDADGQLTGEGSTTYRWDARGQLVGVGGLAQASFAYDAFGRRTSRTVAGATTRYAYDGLNVVTELVDGAAPVTLLGGSGLDRIYARTNGSETVALLRDGLGSTIGLVDGAGNLGTRHAYSPYGEATTTGATTTNALGFAGREQDATGLLYLRGRYYHATRSQFISADPMSADAFAGAGRLAPQFSTRMTIAGALYGTTTRGDALPRNLALEPWSTFGRYSYALASPMLLTDPEGMLTGLGYGVVAGVALGLGLALGIGLGAGLVIGLGIGVGAALMLGIPFSENPALGGKCSPFFGAPGGNPFTGSPPPLPPAPPAPAPLPPDPGLDSGYYPAVPVTPPGNGGAPIKG